MEKKKEEFYEKARNYWNAVPPTVNGMLGGFGSGKVPRVDIQASIAFLSKLKQRLPPRSNSAENNSLFVSADCGAGIGRVTKGLLAKYSDHVDLIEPIENFAEEARSGALLQEERDAGKVTVIQKGLEEWTPEEGKYSLIWAQWCLGHLEDDDLVAFFKRCQKGLREGGLICVKENITMGQNVKDEEDSSWTRTRDSLMTIFREAGLKVVKEDLQHGFPQELFPVRIVLKRGYSLLFFGGLLYAGFLLCLTSPPLQRNLLYLHRAKPFWAADLTKPELYGFAKGRVRPFHIQTPDNERIFAWHVLPFNLYSKHREELEAPGYDYAKHTVLLRSDPEARVVIYMHGTAGTIAATDNRLNTYRTWSLLPGNVHVLTIDYRGFGLSTGEPTEDGLITDGVTAVQWAMDNGVTPDRIAVVGQSLGSAVSIAVANELASQGTYIRALLPICGFASLTQIITTYRLVGVVPILSPLRVYPLIQKFIINNFLYEKWDSATRLRSFADKTRGKDVSITIMHSVYDMDIPYASSRLLFQSAITGSLHVGQDMTSAMDDMDPTVAPDFAKDLVDKRTIGSGGSVYTFKGGEGEKEGRIQYVELDWGGHNRMQKADSVLMALGKALGVL
ncbi:hypothetical protein YB2330_004255 [Saitoella coloradoensis]